MTVPIAQGLLNRLRPSVVYADLPGLTVTAAYMAKEVLSVNFEGDVSQKIPTLTGAVDSPEPYVMVTVEIHVLRTQALAAAYKAQIETNSKVGSINVISDSDTLPDYQIEQCVIMGVSGLTFDGNNAAFTVRLRGVYYVNSDMWGST